MRANVIAIQPYLSKDHTANPTGKLSTRVVQSFFKSAGLSPGYNIKVDNFFSSLEHFSWLLDKKISYVGTLRSDRVDACPQIGERKNIHQSEYFYSEKAAVSSYQCKKKEKRSAYLINVIYSNWISSAFWSC